MRTCKSLTPYNGRGILGKIPLAKFYEIKLAGARVKVTPLGWRGDRIGGEIPVFQWIPYLSQSPVHFRVDIFYDADASTDLREFQIRYVQAGKQDGKIEEVHEENNRDKVLSKEFRPPFEHDDQPLQYFIQFVRQGKLHRLIYSKPIPSNFGFLVVFPAIVGAIVGAIVTYLLTNWTGNFLPPIP